MLTIISPAKTLDFQTPATTAKNTQPDFLEHSSTLIDVLKKQSPRQLKKLMKISDNLATLNCERYQQWSVPFNCQNAKQAILAFHGEVYLGLGADTFTQRDLDFSQKHLRILSGLYGVLKPLDLIQPYRLEMGTSLKTKAGKNLYQFWGDSLLSSIESELEQQRCKVLVNLASNEYSKVLRLEHADHRIINLSFQDYSNGRYRTLGFFVKKARGLMANYIIKNRINNPDNLKSFTTDGYIFNKSMSNEDNWVFTRKSS
jgi:cytoplasmic iron level regulating protein YaaA (DUF328/UPF0246 family)